MSQLTVLANLVAKEDKLEEAKTLLSSLISPTLKEEGCINYDLHQDNEKPTHFFFYENWKSKEALDAHLSSPHLRVFFNKSSELFAAPIEISLASKVIDL